ncbi:MAG: hypothetical protein CVV41_17855 [Candidatus Riflebacteria bacterium HGW-Riflebacteria-1]|jgi:hypothetical protein|nr:MAG: hypothetical protein CVV41_17855 [Candidatus Riflebacteria bacterium HGW-Riflebacteria-1]
MNQMQSQKASPKLKKLSCTQCSGPIELRGGHNVRTIVCRYCGACLDSKKEFAVLHSFLNQKRPFMPLTIGAKGKLKGVNFTVIGVLQYEQREDGEVYRWLEYLLFSYTHGYVYLCYEDGHWVMMHEVKDLPENDVEIFTPPKTKIVVRDKTFKVFECATAKLTYVEGELTWQARQNEAISYLDAICPPYMYSIEKRANEIEYFWGEYLSAKEVSEAFNFEMIKPSTVFACQPFGCPPTIAALAKGSLAASVLTLLLYFIVSSNGVYITSQVLGREVFSDGGVTSEFTIDDPSKLYGLTVSVPQLKNAWVALDVRIVNPQETEEFCNIPFDISYYEGYEGGEHWTEGSDEETAYFRVPESGTYKFEVEGEGNRGETSYPDANFMLNTVKLEIFRGVRLGHHTLAWFFITLLVSAPYFVLLYKFEKKRWDEDDEDD